MMGMRTSPSIVIIHIIVLLLTLFQLPFLLLAQDGDTSNNENNQTNPELTTIISISTPFIHENNNNNNASKPTSPPDELYQEGKTTDLSLPMSMDTTSSSLSSLSPSSSSLPSSFPSLSLSSSSPSSSLPTVSQGVRNLLPSTEAPVDMITSMTDWTAPPGVQSSTPDLPEDVPLPLGGGTDDAVPMGTFVEEEEYDLRCQAFCIATCTAHGDSWDSCLLECNNFSGCLYCDSPCANSTTYTPTMTSNLTHPDHMTLQWSAGSENISTVYILEQKSSDGVWHLLNMTRETSYTLTKKDGCGVAFSVATANLHGVSDYGEIGLLNIPSVDKSTVTHTVDQNDDNVTIIVSWHHPPGWEDAITSYVASFTFNGGLFGSSFHHPDYEFEVNVTTVTLTVPINDTEKDLRFQLYGTDGCRDTVKITKFFTNVIRRTVLSIVKKRLLAVNVNISEAADLSSTGTFNADVNWISLPGLHQGLKYYDLYYGEAEKTVFGIYQYINITTRKTVQIPANATEFRITDLKPETVYGVEIIGHYYTYEDEADSNYIGGHPNKQFTTGVFPTMPTTRVHTTAKSYVVTIPYPPTRLPFHKLSLYIVGPLALALFLAFLACCGTCIYRRQRTISKANLSHDEESIPNIYSSPSYPALLSTCQVKPDVMDRWEISPARIKVGDVLGEGAFGQVLKGLVVGRIWSHQSSLSAIVPREATHGEHTVVAVKMLHKFAEDTQKQEFLREIELMKELGYHPNVVSLLGCCTIQDPICLLVEHCYYGDLLHFLRNRRPQMFDQFKTGRAPRTPCKDALRPLDLLSFARQIAMGMEYISQKGFVHRDLAARNVMVADDKNVKIGDFGLTRYVYDDKVYVNRRGGKLPVKWMSLEAIYDQIFTTKGDVWSYGVVLFEIVTLGAAPYPGISNKDMPKLLKGAYRMEKPDNCSPQIFSLMESTWCDDPELRPGFTEIRNKLEEMMEENVCYMEFDAEKQQCYCYEDSSSDDDSDDLNVEESPMLEPTNQDTAQNSLLATPMLKIPTGAVLQSRSTQNLSAVSPCKRMTPVSLSLNSLNHQKQIPPSWIPRDLVPFGRNFDNRAYYAGQPRADHGITHSALQIQEAQQDMNLYSGIAGSLENMHNNQENPVLAELNLECPHPDSLRLYSNESEKDKSSESVESSIDSCLCEDISDEERHHMIKEFTRSDTFDTSDLSPDTGKYPSLIALKRFTAEGKVLISPTSLDSGVSCDMTTGRLLLEGCRETDLCSDEDLSV